MTDRHEQCAALLREGLDTREAMLRAGYGADTVEHSHHMFAGFLAGAGYDVTGEPEPGADDAPPDSEPVDDGADDDAPSSDAAPGDEADDDSPDGDADEEGDALPEFLTPTQVDALRDLDIRTPAQLRELYTEGMLDDVERFGPVTVKQVGEWTAQENDR